MKHLFITLFLSTIIACGGGGSGGGVDEPDPVPEPLPPLPLAYEYIIQPINSTQSYSGFGAVVNSVAYMRPTAIADSPFVVVAEMALLGRDDNDTLTMRVNLFDYRTRDLTLSDEFTLFREGGIWVANHHLYHMELAGLTVGGQAELSDLDGAWTVSSSAGLVGDDFLTLTYDNGQLIGDDTAGCTVNGDVYPVGGVFGLNLTLTGCDDEGQYSGAVWIDGDRVLGAAASDEHGLNLNYTVN